MDVLPENFTKIPDAIDKAEEDALTYFGAEKVGTHELRVALSRENKEVLFTFLSQRYYAHSVFDVQESQGWTIQYV